MGPGLNVGSVSVPETLTLVLLATVTELLESVSGVLTTRRDSTVKNVNLVSSVMLSHPENLEIQKVVSHVNVIPLEHSTLMKTCCRNVTALLENVLVSPMLSDTIVRSVRTDTGT